MQAVRSRTREGKEVDDFDSTGGIPEEQDLPLNLMRDIMKGERNKGDNYIFFLLSPSPSP